MLIIFCKDLFWVESRPYQWRKTCICILIFWISTEVKQTNCLLWTLSGKCFNLLFKKKRKEGRRLNATQELLYYFIAGSSILKGKVQEFIITLSKDRDEITKSLCQGRKLCSLRTIASLIHSYTSLNCTVIYLDSEHQTGFFLVLEVTIER